VPLNQQSQLFRAGKPVRNPDAQHSGRPDSRGRGLLPDADIVLRPDICSDRWGDCAKPAKLSRLAAKRRLRHLAEIKSLAEERKLVRNGICSGNRWQQLTESDVRRLQAEQLRQYLRNVVLPFSAHYRKLFQ